MRRARRVSLNVALFLLGGSELVAAQAPSAAQGVWRRSARGDPGATPVVLTIEGGGSLGVYEAGMTWALTQLFKQQSNSELSKRDIRLPRFTLAAVSGASAGSINALLAATAWCMRDTGRPPEESLFWRVWISTGVSQLLPSSDSPGYKEGGLFSRQYFDSVLFGDITRTWESAQWEPHCRVPVGATATRLVPEELSLLSGVTAKNQRFASTFDVAVAGAGGEARLRFLSRNEKASAYMGSLVMLPADSNGIRHDVVFGILEASSGYPLAFGPQLVRYIDGLAANHVDTAQFSDGGVFDNGPVGLGLGMFFGGGDWPIRVATNPAVLDSFPVLLYLSPDNRRRWGDSLSDDDARVPGRASALTSDRASGLEAVFRLIQGSIPSARQHELQQTIRLVQALSIAEQQSSERLVPAQLSFASARWHPIIGDWMFGFGGFLGRPLREYDFYVGIYDALEMVAEKIRAQRQCPGEALTGRPSKKCVAEALANLINDPPIPLGSVAPAVLTLLFTQEFREYAQLVSHAPSTIAIRQQSGAGDAEAIAVDLTIARSTAALMVGREDTAKARKLRTCDDHGVIATLVCDGGFASVLDSLRTNREVMSTLRKWRDAGGASCDIGAEIRVSSTCRADARFLALVEDPLPEMHKLMRLLIERLLVTTPMGGASDKTVRAIGFAYLSLDEPYRRGLDLGQTSIPPRRGLQNIVYVLPSYVTGSIGLGAAEAGWEARWNPNATYAFVLPVRLGFGRFSSSGTGELAKHVRTISGLAIALKTGFFLSEIRAGENIWYGTDSTSRHANLHDHLSPELSVFALGGKIRGAVAVRPRSLIETRRAGLIGEFGIGDLNGLLYWAFRGGFESLR